MRLSEKHMDLVTPTQIQELLSNGDGPFVSILLPTERKGLAVQQNMIRFRKLVHEAEGRLKEIGLRTGSRQSLLGPARDRLADNFFWQYQSDGLAVFLAPEKSFAFRVPMDLKENVVVGNRFYVKPLLPVIAGDGRFYVLALSQKGARLFQGTRFTLGEVNLEHVPKSLAEALRFDVYERSVQFHSGASGAAGRGSPHGSVFHGQGAAADDAVLKKSILNFLRHLDNGVCEALSDEHAPLVLAGVEAMRGMYREVNHYRHLAGNDITVNPDVYKPEDLHRHGWEIVKPMFGQALQSALDRFQHLHGTNDARAGKTIAEILPAAQYKRVDTLFLARDESLWGRFDAGRNHVEVHKGKKAGDEDLLDLAVCYTLRNGGIVHVLGRERMPSGLSLAAIFRGKRSTN